MNKGNKILSFLLSVLICSFHAYGLTATETIANTKSKIEGAKTLSADFSMQSSGQSVKGQIYSKGNKFSIVTPATGNWYNGRELYTYDASAKETYLFKPTASELMEINPLLYIKSYNLYKVQESKKSKGGMKKVVLIPKKNGTGIKSISIDINTKSFMPTSVTILPTSGAEIKLMISNIRLNGEIPDKTFEYPKTKYAGIPITDLR